MVHSVLLLLGSMVVCHAQTPGSILHVSSYHQGYSWSDGIVLGVRTRLAVENVSLNTVYLDARRAVSADEFAETVASVSAAIQRADPDVVIASDDPAAQLISASAPDSPSRKYVFAGVNGDASEYEFVRSQTTGIIEVSLIDSLVDVLQRYANGEKIGFLAIEGVSARKDLRQFSANAELPIVQAVFAQDLAQWKRGFVALQAGVDMLIVDNPEGIAGWDADEIREFVERESRIPVGSMYGHLAPLSLVCIAKIPEEQGWWAADAAMKILNGVSPASIPISRNKEGKLIVNIRLAERVGVLFEPEILEVAEVYK